MSKRTLRRARQRACHTRKGEQSFFDYNGFRFTVNIQKWSENMIDQIIAENEGESWAK